MNNQHMKEAMVIAVDHLHHAHSIGMSNREILLAMGRNVKGEMPSEFQVCASIANWYLTEFWSAVDGQRPIEGKVNQSG